MIPNFIWKNKHEGPARENVRRHRSNEGALALPDVQPLGTGRCRLFEKCCRAGKAASLGQAEAGGSLAESAWKWEGGGCFLSEGKMHCSKQGAEITGSQPAGKNKTESLPHPLYPNRFQMEPTFKQTKKLNRKSSQRKHR